MALEQTRVKHPFTRKKQLERDLEHVTKEMYRRNLELAETNRTLSLLRTIDTLVLESHESLEKLGNQITEAIIKDSNYSFVALAGRLPHRPQLQLFGWSVANVPENLDTTLLSTVRVATNMLWLKGEDRAKMIQLTHIPDRKLAHLIGLESRQVTAMRAMLPLQSVYIIKLMARGRLAGVLAIGFNVPTHQLQRPDALLLDRLSEAVGVALDNRLLAEENQLVLKQLEKSSSLA